MRRDTNSTGENKTPVAPGGDTGVDHVGTKDDRGKIGAGVKPTGVFRRIADAEKQSGMRRIIRHTNPETLKK